MDEGKSDHGSLPERTRSAESDHVADVSSLTRRSFLVGAGSVAGAYSTGAFADTTPIHRWSVYRAPDPRAEGRSVVAICFDDRTSREEELSWCFLPEVSLSEFAKATVQSLPSKVHTRDVYDVQAVFSGLELARPENKGPSYFSLIFRFINPADQELAHVHDARVEIVARDLLTPGERLLARLSLKDWRSVAPIKVTDAQLGPALLNTVFATRLRLPSSGKIDLFLVRPTEQDQRLIWRFRAAGPTAAHANGFAVLADQTAKLGETEFRRVMVGSSSSVEMWRAHSALDGGTQAQGAAASNAPGQPAANNSPTPPASNAPVPAATTKDAPKPTPPRTMAQLTAFRPNESGVVVGEYKLSNGHFNSLALGQLDIDDNRPVQLVRRDPSGYPRGIKIDDKIFLKVAIETAVPIGSGELSVRTTRTKKAERREGPFRLEQGTLTLSGAADGWPLCLNGDFQLDCHNTSLLTAFGPFEIERPEDKRVRRQNASNLTDGENGGSNSSQYELRRPVRLSVKNRVITAFEATARVNSVGVALSKSSTTDDHRAYRVDLGFPQGCEVLFRLFGLNDSANTRHGIGRVSLGSSSGATPAKGTYGGPYALPLDNAVLRLRRWRDLICLNYRFAGLDLVQEDGGKAYLVPRGLARQASSDIPPKDAKGKFTDPDMSAAPFDPRAMMVVEFPSQHVAEEAFFEQRIARPAPPRYPASLLQAYPELAKKFDKLRSLYLSQNPRARSVPDGGNLNAKAKQRLKLRKDLSDRVQSALKEPNAPLAADLEAFRKFLPEFEKVNKGLPPEQKSYVGDEFLDPEARRLAEIAANALIIAKGEFFDSLPDDPVNEQESLAALKHQQELNPDNDDKKKQQDNRQAIDKILTNLRQCRDPFFVAFQKAYSDKSRQGAIPKFDDTNVNKALESFSGRAALRDAVETIRQQIDLGAEKTPPDPKLDAKKESFEAFKKVIKNLIDAVQDDMGLSGDEEPTPMSRARLSGPSRLAFRINTDDFETGDQGGRIEFSVSELTNWSRHELVVIRRAQKLLKAYADGSRRPRWDMQEDHDLATQLVHMGFSRGGWTDRSKSKNANSGPRNWSQATLTAEQRLAEVAASAAAPPGPFETAIEMPFRLFLSPAQDGRFRTRREVPPWLLSKSNDASKPPGIVEPLWRAAFEVEPNSALRAVWSPDFRPEAFVPGTVSQGHSCLVLPCPSRSNRPPMRGPYAPWAMGRETSDNPMPPDIVEAPRFRTSLDAFDRHELVTLSSLHGLPVIGKVGTDTQNNIVRLGKDQVEPPEGFQVSTPNWQGVDEEKRKLLPTLNDIYLPKALDPKGLELALSSLGGYLRLNASFDPPASILTGKGQDYYNALSIERWRHNIVLGRDISAEVVYKGYLFPIGLHCTLIKITERRFQKIAGRNGPVAVLRQRMFLRIGNPTKNFPAFQQPDGGRRLPFRTLTVVTTQTPDIVDPYDVTGSDDNQIYPSGRIKLQGEGVRGTAFWPRTSNRFGGEVKFDLLVDGNIPTRMPLIFVDNAAANNQEAVRQLCAHYNGLGASSTFLQALTKAGFAGAKLTYAPESKAGDTQFETQSLVFGAEGRAADGVNFKPKGYQPFQTTGVANANFVSDPFMQGADQPPFYPAMRFATVKIGQIERLVGYPLPLSRVGYDPSYALYGFPENDGQLAAAGTAAPGKKQDAETASAANPKEIFLSLIDPRDLTFGQGGDKGGGVSRPEMTIYALSRKAGPISSSLPAPSAPSAQTTSEPVPAFDQPNAITAHLNDIKDDRKALANSFFGNNATLLGLIKLSDLIEAIITLAGGRVPVLQELVDYGGGLAGDADEVIRERVLEPLQQALAALNDPMTKPIPLGTTGQVVQVSKIYPDVVRAYTALKRSVQAAIDAPPPADGPGDTISVYTAVYTDGRSFVNAIERALRDPLTPLRDAAKNWLNDQVADVKGQFDNAVADFQKILDIFKASLRVQLRNYVVDNILNPLRAAIFVMPRPARGTALPDTTPWATLAELLDTSIGQALKEDSVWPSGGNQPFFDANIFARQVASHFETNAKEEIESGLIESDLVKDQTRALTQIAEARTAAENLLRSEIRKLLTDSNLDQITQDLAGLQIDDTEKLAKLFTLGEPVSKTVQQLKYIANIGTTFQNRCADAVTALTKFLVAALPSSNTVPKRASLDRLSQGLSVLVVKANLINAPGIFPATLDALVHLRTKLQDTIKQTQDRCNALAADLDELRFTVADFESESPSFVAATICRLDLGQPPSWQMQRLLNYVRRLSAQSARCVNGAKELITALGVILQGNDATNVLFARLAYTFPSNPNSTDIQDPAAGSWPSDSPADNNEASYLIDLLRLRFFYLAIGALQESAITVQALSLAGVVLDTTKRGPAFDALTTSITTVLGGQYPQIAGAVRTIYSSDPSGDTVSKHVKTKIDGFNDSAKRIIDILQKNNAPIDFGTQTDAFVNANGMLADAASEVIDRLVGVTTADALGDPFANQLTQPIQAFLASFLDRIAGQFQTIAGNTLRAMVPAVRQAITTPLKPIYAISLDNRNALYTRVVGMSSNVGPVSTQVASALLAPRDGNRDVSNDALVKQKEQIEAIDQGLAATNTQIDALIELFNFIRSWGETRYLDPQNPVNGPNAVLFIANQAKDVVAGLLRDVLKGDLGKIIDFAAIKSDVERRLRELIPSKITLAYDFDTELQEVLDIFLPEEGSRLTLKARTVIDVLNGGSPQVSSSGELGPFSVKILGGFLDIVTLSFDGAKFGSETGGKLKANVVDVQLGEAVSFLQAVSSFFSFGANGFYLSVLFDPPGIEAGYRMPPCGFALGVVGISNISLNAAAILPFDGTPAMFKVGLSRPESPFLINVAVYGGGGHLALYSTAQGIIGFESSFEFGAVVAFAIGPLTGNARITVGIFLRSFKSGNRTLSTIEGYTTVAGSASISIFRFSAMLQVRVGQQPNGEMVGTAIFTFSFSMGIKDIEFRVTARKSMGKGYSSNPQISDAGDVIDPSRKMIQLASNLPNNPVASDVGGGPHGLPLAKGADCGGDDGKKPCNDPVAHLTYRAVCKGEDYAKYQSYFDHHQPWQPAFC